MNRAVVFDAFNRQVRQSTRPDGTGALTEADGPVVRRVPPSGAYGAGVVWSELTAGDADQVISSQLRFFAGRGQKFEWKLYSYDEPADLADRLAAAGLIPAAAEALMVAEVAALGSATRDVVLPDGVRLEEVTDEAGLDRAMAVSAGAFGHRDPGLHAELRELLESSPGLVTVIVAMAGHLPVCAGRIEFTPGAPFAGLWGGGTLPHWRRRGLYRALVAHRARLAAARGYQYLQVDASPQSEPILERLGFTKLAQTTPYTWSPVTARNK